MTTPEFSRPERIDTIGTRARSVTIAADAGERAALARRFGLAAIDRLDATFALNRDASGIVARGTVTATVTQSCVVTGDPVPASVDEAVALRFVPQDAIDDGDDEEIELSADALDTVAYSGGAVDLGEAAAETMALALDPFPRSSRAETALREAGVLSEGEAGPFGALAGLRDALRKTSDS